MPTLREAVKACDGTPQNEITELYLNVHDGFTCSVCSISPIIGARFQSTFDETIVFCTLCEERSDHPHALIKYKESENKFIIPIDASKMKAAPYHKPSKKSTEGEDESMRGPRGGRGGRGGRRFLKDCVPHPHDLALMVMEKYGLAIDDKQREKKDRTRAPKFSFEFSPAELVLAQKATGSFKVKITANKKSCFRGIDNIGLIPQSGDDIVPFIVEDFQLTPEMFGKSEIVVEIPVEALEGNAGVYGIELGLFTRKGALRGESGAEAAKIRVA